MAKGMSALLAAALMLASCTTAVAKTATVTGKLVDEHCSRMSKPHDAGDDKTEGEVESCALHCAQAGEPVAVVTTDGKIYRITGGLAANKNAKLIPHMSRTVEITGDVSERGGKLRIAAESLKVVARK